jgi:hypothetical protein
MLAPCMMYNTHKYKTIFLGSHNMHNMHKFLHIWIHLHTCAHFLLNFSFLCIVFHGILFWEILISMAWKNFISLFNHPIGNSQYLRLWEDFNGKIYLISLTQSFQNFWVSKYLSLGTLCCQYSCGNCVNYDAGK